MDSFKCLPLQERRGIMLALAMGIIDSVGSGAFSDVERKEVMRRMSMFNKFFDVGSLRVWAKLKSDLNTEMLSMRCVQEDFGL